MKVEHGSAWKEKQALKRLPYPKWKFHFLKLGCPIMTSVQANIKRQDSLTTLNTKQSRQMEALGATSTLPEMAGPGRGLQAHCAPEVH